MSDEYRHPAFPPPPHPEVLLWRYLDFEKFDWLASNRRLFMPFAQFLGDPLEGTTPIGHIEWWRALEDSAASEEHRRIIEKNKDKGACLRECISPALLRQLLAHECTRKHQDVALLHEQS